MSAADPANTTGQDDWEAMKLATGRAAMMPIISPLMTAPTTRPRRRRARDERQEAR
jgi:hypothetical protein